MGEVYRSNCSDGVLFECSVCGKKWGPKTGRAVGFTSAAAKSHAEMCGPPPEPDCAKCGDSGVIHSAVYDEESGVATYGRRAVFCDCPRGQTEREYVEWVDDQTHGSRRPRRSGEWVDG